VFVGHSHASVRQVALTEAASHDCLAIIMDIGRPRFRTGEGLNAQLASERARLSGPCRVFGLRRAVAAEEERAKR
jgi:hypothetical protein